MGPAIRNLKTYRQISTDDYRWTVSLHFHLLGTHLRVDLPIDVVNIPAIKHLGGHSKSSQSERGPISAIIKLKGMLHGIGFTSPTKQLYLYIIFNTHYRTASKKNPIFYIRLVIQCHMPLMSVSQFF